MKSTASNPYHPLEGISRGNHLLICLELVGNFTLNFFFKYENHPLQKVNERKDCLSITFPKLVHALGTVRPRVLV